MTVTVLTLQTGNDCGLQSGDSGTVTVASVTANIRNNALDASRRHWGMRMQHASVTIPQGATINTAVVTLTNSHATLDDLNCNVYGHDVDASGSFEPITGDNTLFTRTRTTATVAMVALDAVIDTPQDQDVASILQEIVDRPSYDPASGLTLLFIGRSDATQNYFGYGWGGTTPPYLTVDWSLPVSEPVGVVNSAHDNTAEPVRVAGTGGPTAPTVELLTSDGVLFAEGSETTLEFVGHDADSPDYLAYQLQISTVSNFTPAAAVLEDNFAGGGGGSFHPNPLGTLTWEGVTQVDDRFGQSFTGAGGWLKNIELRMTNDQGQPSYPDGTAYIRVYSHQGIFGTSSAPLNAVSAANTPTPGWLAKSEGLVLTSSMSTSTTWTTFTFSADDQIHLAVGERYVLIQDWVPNDTNSLNTYAHAGDGNNAGALHPGNMYIDGDSANWGVKDQWDLHFRVYEGDSLLDKASDQHTGFLNADNVTQYDPFQAEETIRYIVPNEIALVPDTPYYWRVRAIDPWGSNTYGAWSVTQTFEVTNAVGIASAWHSQIADEVVAAAAAVVSVSLVDSQHSHSADQVTTTQTHSPGVADSQHGHSVDQVMTTQVHFLGAVDTFHQHLLDPVGVSQTHLAGIEGAIHSHLVDDITTGQLSIVSVVEATHNQEADTLTVTQTHTITATDSQSGQTVETVLVTTAHVVGVSEALHGHEASVVSLSSDAPTVGLSGAVHGHLAGAVTVSQTHLITIADASHGHSADFMLLFTESLIPPPERSYVIKAEDRTFLVDVEDRTFVI